MIYLKKIISQDIERNPTFSQAAISGYFCIDIPNGEEVSRKIILKPNNIHFDIIFKHRNTRNEYRIFLNELFTHITPEIGDILIFSKLDATTYECEYIGLNNPQYISISARFNGLSNHQFLTNI